MYIHTYMCMYILSHTHRRHRHTHRHKKDTRTTMPKGSLREGTQTTSQALNQSCSSTPDLEPMNLYIYVYIHVNK